MGVRKIRITHCNEQEKRRDLDDYIQPEFDSDEEADALADGNRNANLIWISRPESEWMKYKDEIC
jgi:hypothetical protein